MMIEDMASGKLRIVLLTAAVAMAGGATLAFAQTESQPSAASRTNPLSLSEIESRLASEGLELEELEIRGRLVTVEARDANGREVEWVIDRSTGETLSRKLDD